MLAHDVDFVIGGDTHKDTHALAICDATGACTHQQVVSADDAGYREALAMAKDRAPGRRLWAIEGTGTYGKGLTDHLLHDGERVVEVERPRRTRRKGGAKSDPIDALRAARETLSVPHLATPRQGDDREALRLLLATRGQAVSGASAATLQVKAFIVSAPEQLRAVLRAQTTREQLRRCEQLRPHHAQGVSCRVTGLCLRSAARRATYLRDEARALEAEIRAIVTRVAPELLSVVGVGPIVAAQLLVSFSHRERFRSEAAFASLAGVAPPLPASSGTIVRHRLSRGGDRQLNRALGVIVRARLARCLKTRAYVARRRAEGKSSREIVRCLKRFVARQLFRLLTRIVNAPEARPTDQVPTARLTRPACTARARAVTDEIDRAVPTAMRSAADILVRVLSVAGPEAPGAPA